jgi:hypothetical protein
LGPERIWEAIGVTRFERGYQQTRKDTAELRALLPRLARLALTPLPGPAETNRFIDGKMKT